MGEEHTNGEEGGDNLSYRCLWCGDEMIQPSDEELPKYGIVKTSENAVQVWVCPKCFEAERVKKK